MSEKSFRIVQPLILPLKTFSAALPVRNRPAVTATLKVLLAAPASGLRGLDRAIAAHALGNPCVFAVEQQRPPIASLKGLAKAIAAHTAGQ